MLAVLSDSSNPLWGRRNFAPRMAGLGLCPTEAIGTPTFNALVEPLF